MSNQHHVFDGTAVQEYASKEKAQQAIEALKPAVYTGESEQDGGIDAPVEATSSLKIGVRWAAAALLLAVVTFLFLASAKTFAQVSGNIPRAVPAATVTNISGQVPVVVTPSGTVFSVSLQACSTAGQYLSWSGTQYVCTNAPPAPIAATITNITGSSPVSVTNTGTVFNARLAPCPTVGQYYAWNGTSYVCTNAPAAGTPATVTNITGSSPVAITNTGTVFGASLAACPTVGQYYAWNGTSYVCTNAPAAGTPATVTNITGSSPVAITNTGTVFGASLAACPTVGQYYAWNGTSYVCTSTSVADFWRSGATFTSTPDSLTDSTDAIVRNGPVGIGTGATTPSTNLHINSALAGDSGLRLQQLTTTLVANSTSLAIGVDALGKVVITNAISSLDTSTTNVLPQAYSRPAVWNEYKNCTTIGLNNTQTLTVTNCGVETTRAIGFDATVTLGLVEQVATVLTGTAAGRKLRRISTSATVWGPWVILPGPWAPKYATIAAANADTGLTTGSAYTVLTTLSNAMWIK
jgi:hypothetical protein